MVIYGVDHRGCVYQYPVLPERSSSARRLRSSALGTRDPSESPGADRPGSSTLDTSDRSESRGTGRTGKDRHEPEPTRRPRAWVTTNPPGETSGREDGGIGRPLYPKITQITRGRGTEVVGVSSC